MLTLPTVMTLSLACLLAEPAEAEAVPFPLQVAAAANKAVYFSGEPVLLRTVVTNVSTAEFKSARRSLYAWGRHEGFNVLFGLEGEDEPLMEFGSSKLHHRISMMRNVRTQEYLHVDWQQLPASYAPGEQAERVDLFVFNHPGRYRIRPILREKDGAVHGSEVLTITVTAADARSDSVSRLDGENFVGRLGSTIAVAYYKRHLAGGIGEPGFESLSPQEFKNLAVTILRDHRQSAFYELTLLTAAVMRRFYETRDSELTLPTRELAERFLAEFPDSWLAPQVGAKLYRIYRIAKEHDKADALAEQLLQKFPASTRTTLSPVVRDLEQQQAPPAPAPTP